MSRLLASNLIAGRKGFALNPLDLDLSGGSVVVLIGPNGVGKTTLLKTLAGLIPPLAGTIQADTRAYLPPPGTVAAGFTALHLVALGRAGRRVWATGLTQDDIEDARSALDRLGILDLADRPFDRLSSGQQQLVLIARLFVQDASVCLLDEPLSLLDPAHAVAVEEATRQLAAEGRLVIASTHDLDFAARADRVLTLDRNGAIAAHTDPLTPQTLSALFGVPVSICACCGRPTCGDRPRPSPERPMTARVATVRVHGEVPCVP
jgi:iron complex transport system ATP-binding protein